MRIYIEKCCHRFFQIIISVNAKTDTSMMSLKHRVLISMNVRQTQTIVIKMQIVTMNWVAMSVDVAMDFTETDSHAIQIKPSNHPNQLWLQIHPNQLKPLKIKSWVQQTQRQAFQCCRQIHGSVINVQSMLIVLVACADVEMDGMVMVTNVHTIAKTRKFGISTDVNQLIRARRKKRVSLFEIVGIFVHTFLKLQSLICRWNCTILLLVGHMHMLNRVRFGRSK